MGHFGIALGSLWGHFGVTLGHFGVTLGHFGVTLGSLWGTLGHFGVTLGPNPGRIRFWTAPCAKVICFAEDFSFPNVPELTATQRDPPPRISIFYQSVNPFD